MRKWITILFNLTVLLLQGQQSNHTIEIQHFGTEQGLTTNTTYDVVKDSRGLIWVGAHGGIHQFDGKKFQNIPVLDFQSVHQIIEDEEGFLWLIEGYEAVISKVKDIAFLHVKTQQVMTFEERFGTQAPFSIDEVSLVQSYDSNKILIGTKNKQIHFYSLENGFQSIKINCSQSFISKAVFIQDVIWLFTADLENGRYYWTCINWDGELISETEVHKSGKWRQIGFKNSNSVLFMYRNQLGEFWLYELNENGELKNISKTNLKPCSNWEKPINWQDIIKFHPAHNIYLVGLSSRFQIRDFKSQELIHEFKDTDLITNQVWRNPFFENDNNCWIPTSNGVFLIRWQKNNFKKLLHFDGFTPSTRGILETEDSTLLVNSYKGSFEIDLKNPINYKHLDFIENVAIPLVQDENGLYWFGTSFHLISWDKANNLVKKYPIPNLKTPFIIQSILDLKDNKIGFLTRRSFGVLNTETGEFKMEYVQTDEQKHWIKGFSQTGMFYSFQRDNAGNIWCLTNNGLYSFDFENGLGQRYGLGESGIHYLPALSYRHFFEDPDSIFWLATGDGGLIRWDRKVINGQHFKQFNAKKGLHSNVLYSLFGDKFGFLWLASDRGLVQFNKETHEFIRFLPKNGITAEDFNRESHFQNNKGTIYFGSLDGITAFNPEDFVQNFESFPEVPLFVTNLEIYNSESKTLENKTHQIIQNGKIVLNPKDQFFNLTFLLDEYLQQEKVTYAYRVQGYSDVWTESSNNNIRLTGIPFGEYDLQIKGRLPNGRFSSQELNIPVIVLRPIYLKWWFLSLVGLVLMLSIIGFFHWRTAQFRKKQLELASLVLERTAEIQQQNIQLQEDKNTIAEQTEKLKQLDILKTNFFTNVSHEFRTPLSLILGPIKNVLKGQNLNNQDFTRLKKAEQNSLELLRLVNEIMDIQKLDVGELALEEEAISIYHWAHHIFYSFDSQARYKNIQFLFQYEPSKYLSIKADKKKLESIIRNLLSNALKFTPKDGEIIFNLRELPNTLQLHIKDNGPGIHPKDLPNIFDRFYQSKFQEKSKVGGTGIGLAISKEYAKLMGGKLIVQSPWKKDQSGSCFILEIPKIIIAHKEPSLTPLIKTDKKKNALHPSSNYHLLIVEDNNHLRQYLKEILEPHYQISVATDGREAIEVLKNNEQKNKTDQKTQKGMPSLIISDLLMPKLDGFELLREIKKEKKWNTIPIIMLTARTKSEDKMKALRLGVDDYLIKPFEENELMVRIENLLKNYKERLHFISSETKPGNMSKLEDPWLEELERTVMAAIPNFNLTMEILANSMNMSRTSFFNKVKKHTGLSPNQYLLEARLMRARKLLENQQVSTVKEASFSVGIKNVKYFSQIFKKRFSKSPSKLLG